MCITIFSVTPPCILYMDDNVRFSVHYIFLPVHRSLCRHCWMHFNQAQWRGGGVGFEAGDCNVLALSGPQRWYARYWVAFQFNPVLLSHGKYITATISDSADVPSSRIQMQ